MESVVCTLPAPLQVQRLAEFVAIPSVSADPAFRQECVRAVPEDRSDP